MDERQRRQALANQAKSYQAWGIVNLVCVLLGAGLGFVAGTYIGGAFGGMAPYIFGLFIGPAIGAFIGYRVALALWVRG